MTSKPKSTLLPTKIIGYLAQWAHSPEVWRNFQRVLLFGSLLRRDGADFRPSTSDIDLLFEFSCVIKSPLQRRDALSILLAKVATLEKELKAQFPELLHQPVISAGACTEQENELGINIGNDPDFAANSHFLDLLREAPASPLGPGMPQDARRYAEEIAVLSRCQEYRKGLLKIAAIGGQAESHAAPDLVPKDMARLTARLRLGPRMPHDDDKYDVVDGTIDFVVLVEDMAKRDQSLETLARSLRTRLSRPAQAVAIQANDLLLMWEVLAQKALNRVRVPAQGKSVNDVLLQTYPHNQLRESLERAETLWLSGLDLRRLRPDYEGYIEDMIKRGGYLNAILLSARSEAVKYAAQQDYGPEADIPRYVSSIEQAHRWLRQLRRSYPSRVQIKMLDFPLTYGLDAIDLNTDNAVIHVLYYPLYSRRGDQPVVVFRPQQQYWFNFYAEQIKKQWEEFGALDYIGWKLRVDRATVSDVPAIRELAESVSAERLGARAGENGFLVPYTEDKYHSFVEGAEHFYVLRVGQDKIIGFVLAHTDQHINLCRGEVFDKIRRNLSSSYLIVQQICIHPDYVRNGYARRLYEFLFGWSDLDEDRYPTAVCFIWKSPIRNSASERLHARLNWRELSPPYALSDGRVAGLWVTPTRRPEA